MKTGHRYLIRGGVYNGIYAPILEFKILDSSEIAYKIENVISGNVVWIEKCKFLDDDFPPPNHYFVLEDLGAILKIFVKKKGGYGNIEWNSKALYKFACAVKADKRGTVPWETFLDNFVEEYKKALIKFTEIEEKN